MIADEPIEGHSPEDVIEPQGPPQSMEGNGKAETIIDQVRRAREAIPVDERGVTPLAYEQQVTIAKDYARASLMLPSHLHGNVPVMVALVGIAARFRLDPMQLASQTYVQNNRLCFQAQAFGAIIHASGLLRGRLRFDFHGEGEDMTCTVSGRFKDDPDVVYSATTPTLKQIHPGYVQKDGKTFVKGSPLYDKDPEQQLAYFGERRWIRRFAPDACMGMYTREEVAEIDDYRAERAGSIPLNADRLGQLDTGEGWNEGAHLDLDLAAIEPELPEPEPEPEPPPPTPRGRPLRKPAGKQKPVGRPKVVPAKKNAPAKPGRPGKLIRGRPPTRGEVAAAVQRAEAGARRVVTRPPRWLDYVTETEAWIKGMTTIEAAVSAEARWEAEREERDRLGVPMGERSRLRAILERALSQLRPKGDAA
jgi:RecT family